MKKLLYIALLFALFFSPMYVAAEEEQQADASDLQKSFMALGFRVFKEKVAAPAFTLLNLEGDEVALSDYLGKYVMLNFWATWCGPCRIEMPSMQVLYEKLDKDKFELLAIDLQESQRTVQKFIDGEGFTFPVLLDTSSKVGSDYGARSIPTTYLIDPEGHAYAFLVGSRNWHEEAVLEAFNSLLAQ